MLAWLTDKKKLSELSYQKIDLSAFEYVNLAKQVEHLLK
jgi:hypothetical protein